MVPRLVGWEGDASDQEARNRTRAKLEEGYRRTVWTRDGEAWNLPDDVPTWWGVPVDHVLQRALGFALVPALHAFVIVGGFVGAVVAASPAWAAALYFGILGLPVTQALYLAPGIYAVDSVRPQVARGMVWGAAATFALWVAPLVLLLLAYGVGLFLA
jgi:hypothetical protein